MITNYHLIRRHSPHDQLLFLPTTIIRRLLDTALVVEDVLGVHAERLCARGRGEGAQLREGVIVHIDILVLIGDRCFRAAGSADPLRAFPATNASWARGGGHGGLLGGCATRGGDQSAIHVSECAWLHGLAAAVAATGNNCCVDGIRTLIEPLVHALAAVSVSKCCVFEIKWKYIL